MIEMKYLLHLIFRHTDLTLAVPKESIKSDLQVTLGMTPNFKVEVISPRMSTGT